MTDQDIKRSIARIEAAGMEAGEVAVRSVHGVEATHRVRKPRAAPAQPKTAQVLYTGQAGRRVVDDYEWTAENGYVQTVEGSELVERLLRNGDFVILENAPETPAQNKEQDGE